MLLEAPLVLYQGYPQNVLLQWKTSKNIGDFPKVFWPPDQHGILTAEIIGVFPEIFSEPKRNISGITPKCVNYRGIFDVHLIFFSNISGMLHFFNQKKKLVWLFEKQSSIQIKT